MGQTAGFVAGSWIVRIWSPPYLQGLIAKNDRDRIAAVYPASLWKNSIFRASMIFARIVLIDSSVSSNRRTFQVFDTLVLPVLSLLAFEPSHSLVGITPFA